MRILTDDGVELAAEVRGEGPALLLVHGFGGAKEDFADHLDSLAATHRVATFDHRGHGESGQPATLAAYSLARLRADVLCVADAIGFERFRLLGHSMGGMVTRRIALDHPDRVEAHVFMDTAPGPLPGVDPELIELAAQLALDEGKDALKVVLDDASPLANAAHDRLLAERPGYEEFCDRKWRDLSHVMWAALARELARQPDDLDDLRTLACPALVIVGELDEQFIGPSAAIAAAVPQARLVTIPGAGHSPQFENPGVWIAELSAFLASVPAAVA